MEMAKATPILAPTAAIALVRFSSVVRSDKSAIMVLATAPVPCSARPAIKPHMESAIAATILPAMKSSIPPIMTGFRPILSDKKPRGI